MNDLTQRRCEPCEGGVDPLTSAEASTLLDQVDGWTMNPDSTAIAREFRFDNFHQTMAFVNALAWIAHREDHHPDLEIGYKRCQVTFSTHAIGGLSENDFICAAKIDQLVDDEP